MQPETVVRWHRLGFRAFWRWRSRLRRPGRPKVDPEVRALIRRMARENSWGAPRIHGELKLLGFDIAERTISRYLPRHPSPPDAIERWKAFLKLHQKELVAMDFFTVPTLSFEVLYVLVFIQHHRRRVIHFAMTALPTPEWILQQLREAFPYDAAPRFLILDRDGLFDPSVLNFLRALAITPVRTAPRSPWQNGVVERWIGSVRRELLDHVVVFHERHLHRLLAEYVAYYLEDRPHLALEKNAPAGRPVERPPQADSRIVAFPRVGGLHHRYAWRAAA
ncbi:MAG: transposase [bacterium]|nr:transposase [bacterium]